MEELRENKAFDLNARFQGFKDSVMPTPERKKKKKEIDVWRRRVGCMDR